MPQQFMLYKTAYYRVNVLEASLSRQSTDVTLLGKVEMSPKYQKQRIRRV